MLTRINLLNSFKQLKLLGHNARSPIRRECASSSKSSDVPPHNETSPVESHESKIVNEVTDVNELKSSNALLNKDKQSSSVQPESNKDWLPEDRPWEGPKPESEIFKPFIQPIVYLSYANPKITDVQDQAMLDRIGPNVYFGYKYPQFNVREDFVDYFKIPRQKRKEVFAKVGITSNIWQYFPEEMASPEWSEIIIIGGGIVGTTIAYMMKYMLRDQMSITVIDKDLSQKNAQWPKAQNAFRTQFSLEENIQSSRFFYKFLKSHRVHLGILDNEPPNLNVVPSGHLFLCDIDSAEKRLDFHEKQIAEGAYVDVLNQFQLSSRFPWLNTEDVAIATHGVEEEGWLDPWALYVAIKGRAEFLGVRFLEAEFVDWNPHWPPSSTVMDDFFGSREIEFVHRLIYRLPCGAEKQLRFGTAIVAAGADSLGIAQQLGLGLPNSGVRCVPLPIEKRKRFNFVFNCPDAPIVDFPFLVDVPSGVWVRREGLGGNFVCGKNPAAKDEEPDPRDLEIDYEYFEKLIWPILVKRVPAFAKLRIVGANAHYIDYNYFDQSPVLGPHPYYHKVYFATGFSGYSMQAAPAAGRAIAEHIAYNRNYDVNLARFNWNRLFSGTQVREEILV